MTFIDLCVACGRAIADGCKAVGRLLARMVRLTYRYWWVVITCVVIGLAGALYYTRCENLTYKLNAVALLNGPSIQQFEQAYAPLRSGRLLPEDASITSFVREKTAKAFTTYRVIDCLHDGNADFIDFKHKSKPYDTLNVQMNDRLCLQFRLKARDLERLPEIEKGIMEYLNGNKPMQQSYASYLSNLREEVRFNHAQALKLDSLTSAYYFYNVSSAQPMNYSGNGVNFYGDRRIRLFLDQIYEQQKHLQQGDYRIQLATAPVVLENHFTADPKPVNGRLKYALLFLVLGWAFGCLIAEIIDQRKLIASWLRQ
ncbi:MAG: hypothetical protein IJR42_06175 [Paludibacteraceae bacterium]|nr:hypothetical protein [Paludibacteraceae bacterium]